MMTTRLYWIDGPWPGRLALASRPRGGEWLIDEITAWRRSGIDLVVSFLEPSEEKELELGRESGIAKSLGLSFEAFPIPDRQVPSSEASVRKLIDKLDSQLSDNKNVVLHCRQGIGRTGFVAACLLIAAGSNSDEVLQSLTKARGASIPETAEQRQWIEHFAATLANFK